ncbi:hypothetical protein [Pajaroellobacter abortibovis]|nr:hypothetical protein [Pajaroellobacter abortibovis]
MKQALDQAIQRRFRLAVYGSKGGETNAFRLVHEEGDALPRLC